jgi:hypothetical protein
MNVSKLEENLQALIANLDEKSFIYDLSLAYRLSQSAINRLKPVLTTWPMARGRHLGKRRSSLGQNLHANAETRNN